jgi:hypothetical protein
MWNSGSIATARTREITSPRRSARADQANCGDSVRVRLSSKKYG